jgi:hypothetical protein
MGTYTQVVILLAVGAGLLLGLRVALRGSRRNRNDVSPVSEQWLADRRTKQD